VPTLLSRSIAIATAWLAFSAAAPAQTPAQDYPTRTIKVIIPLGAGGGGDVFTRVLADELQKALRQPVVVENRPGGSLNIGTKACADAAPDGYTICVLSSEPVVYTSSCSRAFRSIRRRISNRSAVCSSIRWRSS
jgi:tripartite-type tricarboxylate transporter receptor subunit TctC